MIGCQCVHARMCVLCEDLCMSLCMIAGVSFVCACVCVSAYVCMFMCMWVCVCVCRGGFSYRRYRRSPRAPLRGGRKKLRPANKNKKKQELWVFLLDRVFFAPPSISPTNILT